MAIQNAGEDETFDTKLSSVMIDGIDVTHFATSGEPWESSPQSDRSNVSADDKGHGVAILKHGSMYQFTLNVTAFEKLYQDMLDDVNGFCSKPHKINAVNQIESFDTNDAYLTREPAQQYGSDSINRTMTFNCIHGNPGKSPNNQ